MNLFLTLVFAALAAASFGTFGYAALAGRPAITEMKNRIQLDQSLFAGAGFVVVLASFGVLVGVWFMAVGIASAVILLLVAAVVVGYQQRAGLAPVLFVAPALCAITALLYLLFLISD